MKVLLICHSLVTRSNHRLPEELAHLPNIQLEVLVPEWWNEESRTVEQEKTFDPLYRIRVVPTWSVPEPQPNLFVYAGGLREALTRFQPDIIDVMEEPFSLAMGQVLLARQLWAPQARLVFYSFQNIAKQYPPPFSQIEQWCFREASYGCVSASEIGDVLRRKGYTGPLLINPPGVDGSVFHPIPAARTATRMALGIAPEQPLLGYLGRLTPEKGVQDVIAALPHLPSTARLLIVGGGERSALETQAHALGVADRLIYAGAVNRLEAPRFLNAMDMLLVPSRTTPRWKEQFGRVIAEAMLCGVPVLGSDSGAVPEVIGGSGVVFREGDVAAIARAVRLVIDQPALARRMGERGRERALATFTWEQIATDRYGVYRELLSAER